MDRIWQWAWDRYGARYSWAFFAITSVLILPFYLLWSFVVVAYENSGRYVGAAVVAVVAALVLAYLLLLPRRLFRFADPRAADREVDRARALEATYTWARAVAVRALATHAAMCALLLMVAAAIAGASGSRLVQYGILGLAFGGAVELIAGHSFLEAAMRPADR
jgi:adenylate cyclase